MAPSPWPDKPGQPLSTGDAVRMYEAILDTTDRLADAVKASRQAAEAAVQAARDAHSASQSLHQPCPQPDVAPQDFVLQAAAHLAVAEEACKVALAARKDASLAAAKASAQAHIAATATSAAIATLRSLWPQQGAGQPAVPLADALATIHVKHTLQAPGSARDTVAAPEQSGGASHSHPLPPTQAVTATDRLQAQPSAVQAHIAKSARRVPSTPQTSPQKPQQAPTHAIAAVPAHTGTAKQQGRPARGDRQTPAAPPHATAARQPRTAAAPAGRKTRGGGSAARGKKGRGAKDASEDDYEPSDNGDNGANSGSGGSDSSGGDDGGNDDNSGDEDYNGDTTDEETDGDNEETDDEDDVSSGSDGGGGKKGRGKATRGKATTKGGGKGKGKGKAGKQPAKKTRASSARGSRKRAAASDSELEASSGEDAGRTGRGAAARGRRQSTRTRAKPNYTALAGEAETSDSQDNPQSDPNDSGSDSEGEPARARPTRNARTAQRAALHAQAGQRRGAARDATPEPQSPQDSDGDAAAAAGPSTARRGRRLLDTPDTASPRGTAAHKPQRAPPPPSSRAKRRVAMLSDDDEGADADGGVGGHAKYGADQNESDSEGADKDSGPVVKRRRANVPQIVISDDDSEGKICNTWVQGYMTHAMQGHAMHSQWCMARHASAECTWICIVDLCMAVLALCPYLCVSVYVCVCVHRGL